ncbi:alpha/beta hydrolase family protein [Sphingobacterium athyrii]|nr:prolyl oligopeptidase family serine peptidase [Sphingobacterium athyrii]
MGLVLVSAKNQEDTINSWRAKFASLSNLVYQSKDANWIAIKKISKLSTDSIFVINAKNHGKTVHRIMNAQLLFLNEEGVLGQNEQKALFLNLTTGDTFHFNNVIKTYILEDLSRYALLFKDRRLKIYNSSGKMLLEITDVEDLPLSDSRNTLFFKNQKDGKNQVIAANGGQNKVVYSTENKIRKIQLISSGKQLIITEATTSKEQDRLIIFDTQSSGKKLLDLDIPKKSIVKLSEIQDGESFLIGARVESDESNDPLVEVWYGNDSYVNEHFMRFNEQKFWLWKPKSSKLQAIEVPKNNEVSSLNNDRYFMTYPPRKGHNFITSEPELNEAKVYDLKLNTLNDLGNLKLVKRIGKEWPLLLNHEIFCSADGKWFLASKDGVKWILYNCNGKIEYLIDKTGLEQPVFSKNGYYIYFESGDDLWIFNIKQKILTAAGIGKEKMTKITNYVSIRNKHTMASFLPTDCILVETLDRDQNVISYKLFDSGKWKQIIPPTENRLTNNSLIYNPDMTSFYTLEENYNLPPTLYSYDTRGQKLTLFDGNIRDNGAKRIRQEIYSYSAVGKNLNGILYYPTNFNSKKKYPMVVRIYDMQRHISNDYLSPNKMMPEGFQIRTLLERGYFVYLPDTTVGENGPGISALECVHNALDVVLKNPNIDQSKIGLCGQSYGGYKTNFIATHSNRFAAFISGAGISDNIRDFYSYNYAWNKPLYFIYNTVYQMNTTVSADMERYIKNNPILNVEKVNAPILLWAGKNDRIVPWDQTMEFYIGLRRYNKDVIALFYKNGNHSFMNETPEEIDASTKVLNWWDYFLKGKQDLPWIVKLMKKDAL